MIGLAAMLLAVSAQTASDRNCTDDQGVDRCAAEQQGRTRALFGLRSIEQHREAGDQVRRVFYVDGYGRDMIAISVVRPQGREPMASVHFPRRQGRPEVPPLEAPVPHAVWAEMLRRSEHFDRSFAPVAEDPEAISICLHSWVYTVEANDPARANLVPTSLRRKTEDACVDGPAGVFAWDLQRAVLPLFPHCDRLDPAQHRNPASQLADCAILAGDRMAAAEVMNRLEGFRRARRVEDAHELRGLFAHRARIDWNGTRSDPNDPHQGDFWMARMTADGVSPFYYERIEGLAADRVRVTGTVQRRIEGPEGSAATYYRAPVEMIWIFTTVQEFQVESATVGAWERYRPG